MAGEIQVVDDIGMSLYVVIFNLIGQIWNTVTLTFESVTSTDWSKYAIFLSDTSPATGVYTGNFPDGIMAGDYPVVTYQATTSGTAAVGDSTTGARDVMHWDGAAEIPISGMSASGTVNELYDSYVVNTTTFRSIMQGWAAVNLGDLSEDEDHSSSIFTDVNDPDTIRVRSQNTATTRNVQLN